MLIGGGRLPGFFREIIFIACFSLPVIDALTLVPANARDVIEDSPVRRYSRLDDGAVLRTAETQASFDAVRSESRLDDGAAVRTAQFKASSDAVRSESRLDDGAALRTQTQASFDVIAINETCVGFPRNINHFAFLHISKCGGTNLLQVLRDGGLTKTGHARFIGEFENSCQQHQLWQTPGVYAHVGCSIDPDVYMMSSIRNPFGYYVSFWQMLIMETQRKGFDIERYGCVGPAMKKHGLLDTVHKSQDNNRTSFARFIDFFINELPKVSSTNGVSQEDCKLTMANIYKRLLLTDEGEQRFDDMMVMEDSWPSIMRVLRRVECLLPGSVDFDYLEERARKNPKGECHNKKKERLPYHCFYDAKTQALVEDHDKMIMQRHGYSFAGFHKASNGSCENVVD
jgi:hypothetical protein